MGDVTWGDIFNDFCARYPKLKERVMDYRPYKDLTIVVALDHDSTILYDLRTGLVQIVSNDVWKEV